MYGFDVKVDLQNLPFADSTYDFALASHDLEHVPNDIKAVSEIHRILKPSEIAIFHVPLVSEKRSNTRNQTQMRSNMFEPQA
jgi:ubiquinone/menaquinone biosynthesis C-methylase UbiE